MKAINQKITINHTIIELLNNTIKINEKNNGTNNGVNNGNFERPYGFEATKRGSESFWEATSLGLKTKLGLRPNCQKYERLYTLEK